MPNRQGVEGYKAGRTGDRLVARCGGRVCDRAGCRSSTSPRSVTKGGLAVSTPHPPLRPGLLSGRVAVVTGAARGIGRAACVALAGAGADVAGIDIAGPVSSTLDFAPASRADLDETGRLVSESGAQWLAHVLDQRDIGALREAAEAIEAQWGGIDVVFANAGIQAFKPLLDMTDPDWHDQIGVNLTGTANTVRVFAPVLVRRGGGRIIVTSSTQGQHGTKFGAAYSASKWGIIGLMKSAALELGPHQITVNAVIPGLVNTVLTRHEDRYAQALTDGGTPPTGDLDQRRESSHRRTR